MTEVTNGVVEVVFDEVGSVSVYNWGLSNWQYMWCVFGDEGLGDVESIDCDIDNLDEVIVSVKRKFESYKNLVKDSVVYDEETNWDVIERMTIDKIKKMYGDGGVYCIKVGEYSIECDLQFVVIIMKGES